MPQFSDGQFGCWRITRAGMHLEPGYHTPLWVACDMPVLLRKTGNEPENWDTWISLSPHEIESQQLACSYAAGHTMVIGLGFGFAALNIALNQAVSRITIVERDPELIALFEQSGALTGISATIVDKIKIVQGDHFATCPAEPVDFLYVDIWRELDEPHALEDVRRIQANIKANSVYFKGQELSIYAAWNHIQRGEPLANGSQLTRAIAEIGLPLLHPVDIDYPAMIEAVVLFRRNRGLMM